MLRKKLGKQELVPILHWELRPYALQPALGDDLRKQSIGEQFQTFSFFDEAHNSAMDRLDYELKMGGDVREELRKALYGRLSSLVLKNRVRGLVESEKRELKSLNKAMHKLKKKQ